MANFSWFGNQEHRVFNYKPIYYDPEEEARKKMFGHVDGTEEKEKAEGKYVPGSHIQGSFRDGNYARRRGGTKAQSIIGLIGMILLVAVLIYIAKFYSLL